jgi:D-tyrosyl-tRNA(Tyr) deacylase
MRAVVQRVSSSSVAVDGVVIGKTKQGLLVLLGVTDTDTAEDVQYICEKVSHLRIFEDEQDKMNLSVMDIGGEVCVVSQFTLYGDARKGRRPNFMKAAPPAMAERLYLEVVETFKEKGLTVSTGQFQAHMQVSLVNDGPVTILLDSSKEF